MFTGLPEVESVTRTECCATISRDINDVNSLSSNRLDLICVVPFARLVIQVRSIIHGVDALCQKPGCTLLDER
jgi:hypothetical protein